MFTKIFDVIKYFSSMIEGIYVPTCIIIQILLRIKIKLDLEKVI